MKTKVLALALAAATTAGLGVGLAETASAATSTSGPHSTMVFATANIGRNYWDKKHHVCHADVPAQAMTRIKDNINAVSNGHPRYIGWQEIDEDNCAHEMSMLKGTYKGWQSSLNRTASDPLKVPEVAHDANKSGQRVAFGSSGVKHHSPTRFITVTRYSEQKISHINTHFIADAYKSNATYTKLWQEHWKRLRAQVAEEHKDGFNVVITADWNRHVSSTWNPAQIAGGIAAGAKLVRSSGVDHIVAIPAARQHVEVPTYKDGSKKEGSWEIGIDGHHAQWVALRFLE